MPEQPVPEHRQRDDHTSPAFTPEDSAQLDRVLAHSHPIRHRIVRYLHLYGPANVGTLATALGVAVGSISHHCRPLHTHGIIVPCPEYAKDSRESYWQVQAAQVTWSTADFPHGSRGQTLAHLAAVAAEKFAHDAKVAWLQDSQDTEDSWRSAATFTQIPLHLTATELQDLNNTLNVAITDWLHQNGHTTSCNPTSCNATGDTTTPDAGHTPTQHRDATSEARMVLVSLALHPTKP